MLPGVQIPLSGAGVGASNDYAPKELNWARVPVLAGRVCALEASFPYGT